MRAGEGERVAEGDREAGIEEREGGWQKGVGDRG